MIGSLVEAARAGGGAVISVIEPATERVMAELPRAGAEEVDAAVARGEGGVSGLARRFSAPTGRRCCASSPTRSRPSSEELAVLEARNAGKPIGDARGEIGMVVETFRFYAGAPERLLGQTIPVAGGVDMTFREPLGVVGLIVPWNFPLTIASWKVAPALAAGNTVVLKPAELTPLSAVELERIALEAGLPEGVLNVVAGPGSVCGAAPGRAPRRRQDRLHRLDRGRPRDRRRGRGDDQAGDPGAGRQVGQRRLRRRGHRARGRGGAGAVFGNAGQDCCARSRILVERSAVDDFLAALGARWSRRSRSATRSTRRPRWGR